MWITYFLGLKSAKKARRLSNSAAARNTLQYVEYLCRFSRRRIFNWSHRLVLPNTILGIWCSLHTLREQLAQDERVLLKRQRFKKIMRRLCYQICSKSESRHMHVFLLEACLPLKTRTSILLNHPDLWNQSQWWSGQGFKLGSHDLHKSKIQT